MKPEFRRAGIMTSVPAGYVAVVRDLGKYRDTVETEVVKAFPFIGEVAFVPCASVQREERIRVTTKDARHFDWNYTLEWSVTDALTYMKVAPLDIEQQLVRISKEVIQRVIAGTKTLDDLLHHHPQVADELSSQISESLASRNWGISTRFLLTEPHIPGVDVDEVEGLNAQLERVYPLLIRQVALDAELAQSRAVGEANAYAAAKRVEIGMYSELVREVATARAQGAEAFAATYQKYLDALSACSQKVGTGADPMMLGYAFLTLTERLLPSSGVEGDSDALLGQMKERLSSLYAQRIDGKAIAAKADAAGVHPGYILGAETLERLAAGVLQEWKGARTSTTAGLDATLQKKYGIEK